MPGMIDPGGEREANFPDNLRPHVQSFGGGLPFAERESRPELIAIGVGKRRKRRLDIHDWEPIYSTGKTVATARERAYIKRSQIA